jgi:hypothetical protein
MQRVLLAVAVGCFAFAGSPIRAGTQAEAGLVQSQVTFQ